MHLSATILVALASTAVAWLPGENRQIVSRDGVELFNRKSLYDVGRVKKRFLPGDYGNDKGKVHGVILGESVRAGELACRRCDEELKMPHHFQSRLCLCVGTEHSQHRLLESFGNVEHYR
jgi:hypothetical protein